MQMRSESKAILGHFRRTIKIAQRGQSTDRTSGSFANRVIQTREWNGIMFLIATIFIY